MEITHLKLFTILSLWFQFEPQIDEALKMLNISLYERNHLLALRNRWFDGFSKGDVKGECD